MTPFETMRAKLIERGLLSSGHRLTEAGHAHVDALMVQLAGAEAPCNPGGQRVVWNTKGRGLQPKTASGGTHG